MSVIANPTSDIEHLAKMNAQGYPADVTVKENKKEYPSFDWVVVSEYDLNK